VPSVLDTHHEVTDQLSVELDDDRRGETLGVDELLFIGSEIVGDLGEPLPHRREPAVRPRRLRVPRLSEPERESCGSEWLSGLCQRMLLERRQGRPASWS
jgi:hypothetical protein